ncbi:MAG: hypothetical protein LBI11_06130 [Streptococcaceae bacterium]|nr:hypothetical protein [Streptococcaceae bacterium]
MILLICFYLGVADALVVANIMIVATSVYLGMGYWVFEQMLAYSLIIFLYFSLMRFKALGKLGGQIMISFFVGMFYGFLISLFEVFLFRMGSFLAYYVQGVSFDVMHGIGNVIFMMLLKKPFEFFNRYFLRFKRK